MRDYHYVIDCAKRSVPALPLLTDAVVASLEACVDVCNADQACGDWNFFNDGRCQTMSFRVALEDDCNVYVTGIYTIV